MDTDTSPPTESDSEWETVKSKKKSSSETLHSMTKQSKTGNWLDAESENRFTGLEDTVSKANEIVKRDPKPRQSL